MGGNFRAPGGGRDAGAAGSRPERPRRRPSCGNPAATTAPPHARTHVKAASPSAAAAAWAGLGWLGGPGGVTGAPTPATAWWSRIGEFWGEDIAGMAGARQEPRKRRTGGLAVGGRARRGSADALPCWGGARAECATAAASAHLRSSLAVVGSRGRGPGGRENQGLVPACPTRAPAACRPAGAGRPTLGLSDRPHGAAGGVPGWRASRGAVWLVRRCSRSPPPRLSGPTVLPFLARQNHHPQAPPTSETENRASAAPAAASPGVRPRLSRALTAPGAAASSSRAASAWPWGRKRGGRSGRARGRGGEGVGGHGHEPPLLHRSHRLFSVQISAFAASTAGACARVRAFCGRP